MPRKKEEVKSCESTGSTTPFSDALARLGQDETNPRILFAREVLAHTEATKLGGELSVIKRYISQRREGVAPTLPSEMLPPLF